MSPSALRRSKAAANRRGALLPSLLALLVFLASSHHGPLRGVDAQLCDEAFTDCEGHDTCSRCVFAFDEDVTCDEHIASDFDFGNTNNCGLFGVSYCCAAEATGDLDSCLEDGYTIEYWECILEQHGCSITDMPCFLSDDRSVGAGEEDSGAARGAATTSTATAAVALAVGFAAACSVGSFSGL